MSTSTEKDIVKNSSTNDLASIPCVVCDQNVIVRTSLWETFINPAAVCDDCYNSIDRGVIHQLYLLRCQVRDLLNKLSVNEQMTTALREDISELYDMYKELSK
jgi:hypothetical protein